MSIINKMLKDIEKRKPQPDLELEKTVEVEPIYDYATLGKRAGIGVLLCSVVILAYVFIPQKKASDLSKTQKLNAELAQPVLGDELAIQGSGAAQNASATSSIENQNIQNNSVVNSANSQAGIDDQKIDPNIKTQSSSALAVKVTDEPVGKANKKDQAAQADNEARAVKNKVTPAQAKINVRQISTQERADNWFNKGKEAFKFGLIEDAIIDLDKALTLMPLHIDARSLLAAAYYGRGELAQADAILRQGLRFNPDVMRWRVLLAKILTEQQSYQSVLPVLSQQFERYANIDFWILKGTAAQQLGENDIALNCFRQLTQLQPEQAKWWLALASASEIAADKYNARRYYMTALQLGGLSPGSQDHAEQRLLYLGAN